MRTMPNLPPKSQPPQRPMTHKLETLPEQSLRQYLEANNLLSQASRAIGEQMKARRSSALVDS